MHLFCTLYVPLMHTLITPQYTFCTPPVSMFTSPSAATDPERVGGSSSGCLTASWQRVVAGFSWVGVRVQGRSGAARVSSLFTSCETRRRQLVVGARLSVVPSGDCLSVHTVSPPNPPTPSSPASLLLFLLLLSPSHPSLGRAAPCHRPEAPYCLLPRTTTKCELIVKGFLPPSPGFEDRHVASFGKFICRDINMSCRWEI